MVSGNFGNSLLECMHACHVCHVTWVKRETQFLELLDNQTFSPCDISQLCILLILVFSIFSFKCKNKTSFKCRHLIELEVKWSHHARCPSRRLRLASVQSRQNLFQHFHFVNKNVFFLITRALYVMVFL